MENNLGMLVVSTVNM